MSNVQDIERYVEFEFVRATENAALNAIHWLGRGNKEAADEAACDAINGVFDLVDICGEVVIGEWIKDKAPGIFLGDKLGKGKKGSPRSRTVRYIRAVHNLSSKTIPLRSIKREAMV